MQDINPTDIVAILVDGQWHNIQPGTFKIGKCKIGGYLVANPHDTSCEYLAYQADGMYGGRITGPLNTIKAYVEDERIKPRSAKRPSSTTHQ